MTVNELHEIIEAVLRKDIRIGDYEVQIGADFTGVTHAWAISEMLHGEQHIEKVFSIT